MAALVGLDEIYDLLGTTDRCVDYCSSGDVDGFAVVALVRSSLILCLLIHRKFTFG